MSWQQEVYHFIYMGGYGYYVWPAYGITLLIIIFNLAKPFKLYKKNLKNLSAHDKRSS